MIRLIVFLIVATLVAIAALYIANNPGDVQIAWEGYRIDTSVGVIFVALLVFAIVVGILVELVRWLRVLPKRTRQRREVRHSLRGYQELSRGLVAAAAGNAAGATRHTRVATKYIPDDSAILLLSAQSAQLRGDEQTAQLNFRQMLRSPETEALGLRGLLAQAMKAKDHDEALELARRAHASGSDTPWAAGSLFELLTRKREWSEALPVVDALERQSLMDAATAARHRAALTYLQAVALHDAGRSDEALVTARKGWRRMPSYVPAALLVSRLAREAGRNSQARRVIETTWEVEPHPELAQAYAELVPEETAAARLKRFGRLRVRKPQHPVTLQAMAELALRADRLDAAREYLDLATERAPTQLTCRLMAEYEQAANRDAAAVAHWRERATAAEPDPAWVCEDTGEIFAHWQPFGGAGRFNSVVWMTPPKLSTLAGRDRPLFVLAQSELVDPSMPVTVDGAAATVDHPSGPAGVADPGNVGPARPPGVVHTDRPGDAPDAARAAAEEEERRLREPPNASNEPLAERRPAA